MKILITGGKSALALKFIRAFPNDYIVFADYDSIPELRTPNYHFISLGQRNEETLAHQLLTTCLDNDVEMILPLHLFEQEALARAGILFDEFNVYLLLPEMNKLPMVKRSSTLKITNLAIFKQGELIFGSIRSENLIQLAQDEKLNGAYDVEIQDDRFNYYLITL